MRNKLDPAKILSWIDSYWMDYASGVRGDAIARLEYKPSTQCYRVTWGGDVRYEGPEVEKAASVYNMLGKATWEGDFLVRIRVKGVNQYVVNKNAFINARDDKNFSPHSLTYGWGTVEQAKVWTDPRQLRRDIAVKKCIKRGETWSKLEAVWPDGSTSLVMEAAREDEQP